MIIKQIPLNQIEISGRHISTKNETVAALKQSIAELGMIEPLIVRHGKKAGIYLLVIGAHRAEACRQLGRESVPCIVANEGEQWSALTEIDENLVRRALTPTERGRLGEARKTIYEQEHPETKHGGAPGAGKGKGKVRRDAKLASFVADTAAITGRSKRAIARDVQRGEALLEVGSDAAEKVFGTSLDKGKELDALAKLPIPIRADLIERAAAGENVSAAAMMTRAVNPILHAWDNATSEHRTEAIHHLIATGMCRGIE
jgi:ParB family chromosome partitioning protein